ncbi:MAG TPA: histidinol-phosphate transaminase [Bacteroidota bacterium]|nr:histidinol-phosphate transaminase [Bacteroidota bacterium]
MTTLLRAEIGRIAEYTLKERSCRIKLNQNENPFELPQEIKEDVLRRVGSQRWSRYPAFVPAPQIAQVARFTGWTPDGVLLGNGSNDLLQILFTCAVGPGRGVVLSQPTFTLYRLLAETLGAEVTDVPMTSSFAFDIDGVIRAARGAAMVVLCSPNNPTGTQLARTDLERILASTDGLVVIDEAYVHFAGSTVVPLLERNERLVVLQTFSKAMGAAGVRFGYALLAPTLARQVAKAKLPYAVNIFTLTAAEVFMERWDALKSWIDVIVGERERVFKALTGIGGVRVHPSSANFLLFETLRKAPGEVFALLLERGILIRDVSHYPMLARGLRVSMGSPDENTEFLDALREAV